MSHRNVKSGQDKSPKAKPAPNGRDEKPADNGQPAAPDPYDIAALRLKQDWAAATGLQKTLIRLPVRKPAKEWFVRCHPDEDYRVPLAVIEIKGDRGSEMYLVSPALHEALAAEPTFRPKLFTL